MAYSSKYYDPVKAHEYYMKHRKLKGKTRSTVLNETGKKAQTYVKNQISEEQKKVVETEGKNYKSRVEKENKRHKDAMFSQIQTAKVKISALQKKYSKLSPAQKRILGPKIKAELQKIKTQNETRRKQLESINITNRNKLSEQHSTNVKNINKKYSKIYESEVDKMHKDSKLADPIKKKSTKKTTKKKK